ncbi:unnamed protein product, partial [Mesorhabditis belari]|uniref:N-acyl-aliphatic-L-amino acid amidohydrolase n=1 Tax=Mesorhabditis belari TaxID=2138241 RepID=A0AAF3ENP9_9BILA
MTNENVAVTNFRQYLRIRSVPPEPDYEGCVSFLSGLADELRIEKHRYEPVKGFPCLVLTIPGTSPNLPSIMFYSHMDVVPVFEEHWKHDPFSAVKEENGDIYGRGTQDMKCVGIQYIEALRKLFEDGKKQFLRTIHLIYGADEEMGGYKGMAEFTKTKDFEELNVGWIMDEGLASPNETYQVYYGERNPWWGRVTFVGNPGHVMEFIENTAMEKLNHFLNSALAYRAKWKKTLESDPNLKLGDVPTINLPIVKGGVQANVIPDKFVLEFSIRVPPTMHFDSIKNEIEGWVEAAGRDVHLEWVARPCVSNITETTNENPFWVAFEKTLTQEGCKINKAIFPGSTDSKHVRQKGYKSLGFSPMNNTPVLLHDHNEFLNEKVFLRGVEIYEKLIENLANVSFQ